MSPVCELAHPPLASSAATRASENGALAAHLASAASTRATDAECSAAISRLSSARSPPAATWPHVRTSQAGIGGASAAARGTCGQGPWKGQRNFPGGRSPAAGRSTESYATEPSHGGSRSAHCARTTHSSTLSLA